MRVDKSADHKGSHIVIILLITMCIFALVSMNFSTAFGVSDESKKMKEKVDMEYTPGEILIEFNEEASAADQKNAKDLVKAKQIRSFSSTDARLWKLGKDVSVDKAIKTLQKSKYCDDIEYMEPNYIITCDAIPDDDYRGDLWGMHNIGQSGGTTDADVDALEAWDYGYTGSSSIVVGVIDSGVDYLHEDLVNNIWENPGETGLDSNGLDKKTNNVDDDNNGYIDDFRGWDFVNNDNDPTDDFGHGTHCAGTIGGMGDNGIGVAGVCWDVQIMPLKFLNSGGSGTTDNAILAVEYAASFKDGSDNNIVRITSNSWGGGRKSKTLENAIKNSGSLFIASAGNRGSSKMQYPAAYNLDNVISVAATNHNDGLASFSNYGSNWVDLGAPGVDILSSVPDDEYELHDGTSMAAPHVSGAAALIMAHTTKTNSEVKTQIMNTVDPLSSLNGITASGGRLNVRKAMGIASEIGGDSTPPSTISTLLAGDVTPDSVILGWTAPGDDGVTGSAYLYDVRFSTSSITESNWENADQAIFEPAPASSGTVESFTVTRLLSDTTYYFGIKAMDEVGNCGSISNIVSKKTDALPLGAWTVTTIETEIETFYHSFDYDSSGNPAMVYGVDNAVKFSHWNPTTEVWDITQIDSGRGLGMGYDLEYDSNGIPGISYGSGKVKFAKWNPSTSSWDIDTAVSKFTSNEETSLAYDSNGYPMICHRATKNGGMALVSWDGSSWNNEIVSPGTACRWNSMEVDSNGNPGLAFSADVDSNGWLDSVKYAYKSGNSWVVENVYTHSDMGGSAISIAFDNNDKPGIAWCGDKTAWYASKATGVWVVECFDDYEYSWETGLTYSSNGVPYIGYSRSGGEVRVASYDSTNQKWNAEVVEYNAGINFDAVIRFAPGETKLGMGYTSGRLPKVAEKDLV